MAIAVGDEARAEPRHEALRPIRTALLRHGVEPAAILPGELAQMVAIAGDDHLDEGLPLLEAQLREIGLAEAVEIFAAHRAAVRHRGAFVRGRIDHAAPPVTEVLAAAAAELAVACVASGITDGKVGVEPAEADGLAMADGAEAPAEASHGSNL